MNTTVKNFRPLTKISDLQIEEHLAKTSIHRGMFKKLMPLIYPIRYLIFALITVEILQVISIFIRPWAVKYILDSGFQQVAGKLILQQPVLLTALAILVLSWICRFALAGLSKYLSGRAALRVINDLRRTLFQHIQSLNIGYFDRTKAGRIISRADRDVDTLEPVLIQGPPELLSAMLRCGLASILLWHIYPPFFWCLFAILPILFGMTAIFKKSSQKHWGRVAEERSRFTAHLVETVNGAKIIQQLDYIETNQHRYQDLLKDFNNSIIYGSKRTSWFAPFTGLLSTIATAAFIVIGSYAYSEGTITIGQFAESIFYVFLFLAPLQELTDLFERYANGAACAQRIFLLLDTESTIQDQVNAVKLDQLNGHIRFQAVHFAYTTKPVLQNFNLEIEAGKVVAIVGPTGHGKSTIVQLLTRFYEPQQGGIFLDRYPLQDIHLASLRQHVSIVLQDNVLFSGSILDNLRLVQSEGSDQQLIQAIEDLGADEILQQLPQGYFTEVGALGKNLSHGQRQLVCLVRAYLADPKILILDEATSAIDIYTEQKIQYALRRLCQNRTCIVIAHRLSTIREADKIVVIENGTVVEQGSHEQLLQQQKAYYQLYQSYLHNQLQ
ncbi:ABC transporter ATP-binding protein [Acinetobacter ursingii]|uniref:ABC transporter ATP-binding protein n=1 Tax=Acinetobacter ursingii TaxID=108980 RepID=UPI0021CD3E7B|nr:ABC transporter ATP-binding protein [Acinetobacter ursingii]MCU4481167.1 ABC transporter ATP-binding protein/permease [Acinetobacter ursingii]MCU4505496.1 ABC transporter ATP-binding protein/permease [Acinetobacter ursingii]MCU4569499.1 ABC transporter ATP-binding protein/permease [Acinetobacter ursingii]